MKRALRTYGRYAAAIVVLVLLAAVSGSVILVNQRLSIPFKDRYFVKADLTSASGLAPGLGQAVNVAGVRVGQVASAKVVDGRARITMEIDPDKLPRVYDNAVAELVADTPLKDLVVELGPGRPPGKPLDDDGLITIANTSPPVDSDELTNALDSDTREFFGLLVSDFATGVDGRGKDLNELLRVLEPTARQTERVTSALAARRRELKRLVTNLTILTKAAAEKDGEIGRVVVSANATLEALASEEGNLRATLDRLPGTLSSIRSSLTEAGEFATELGPTLDRLHPSVEKLPAVLRDVAPLVETAPGVLRTRIRPLVREAVPLARAAKPALRQLSAQTPDLSRAFQVLTYTVNELAFNPEGSDEGYLYWLAWFAHNAASIGSVQDAQGAATRGMVLFSCDALTASSLFSELLPLVFTNLPVCPDGP